MTTPPAGLSDGVERNGYRKPRPIGGVYAEKGSVNTTFQIVVRPPAPAPMHPAAVACSAPEPASKPA